MTTSTKVLLVLGFVFLLVSSESPLLCQEPIASNELVDLVSVDSSFLVQAAYARSENFLGIRIYPKNRLFLLRQTAEHLARVQARLRKRGLGLKIWDGYRPLRVQEKMWELVPDERYVANPDKGSMHNRGCAVDVTLVDDSGNEQPMPTPHDDFSERAHLDYADLPDEVLENRRILQDSMVQEGFAPLATEWWHFAGPNCEDFPILDVNPYSHPLFPTLNTPSEN